MIENHVVGSGNETKTLKKLRKERGAALVAINAAKDAYSEERGLLLSRCQELEAEKDELKAALREAIGMLKKSGCCKCDQCVVVEEMQLCLKLDFIRQAEKLLEKCDKESEVLK